MLQEEYPNEEALACNTVVTVAFRVWDTARPDVNLRVWHGHDYVDVLLCYKCGEFSVVGQNVRGPFHLARTTPFAPFSERPAWVRLAKDAFPHDADIQSLSESEP